MHSRKNIIYCSIIPLLAIGAFSGLMLGLIATSFIPQCCTNDSCHSCLSYNGHYGYEISTPVGIFIGITLSIVLYIWLITRKPSKSPLITILMKKMKLILGAILILTTSVSITASVVYLLQENKEDSPQTSTIKDKIESKGANLDTGQTQCFDNDVIIDCPSVNSEFYGQDAQYSSKQPSYTDNNDGTITDEITGLMWQKDFTITTWEDANTTSKASDIAGYRDWRIPTIKELYSLMNFNGNTGSNNHDTLEIPEDAIPYIDTNYFDFEYGQENRFIDAQYISSTKYVSTTMNNTSTFFGVNFADGRIKGYPVENSRRTGYYLRLVRGDEYGENQFIDNANETITDHSTGLMWMKNDSGEGLNWNEALNYCESLELDEYTDWRLPNAKELQYIVDYTKSPASTSSAAIDTIFNVSSIQNEKDELDYPYYWTSTTHLEGNSEKAAYIAFGRALGYMNGQWMDVHGAGAQRSDPKTGDPSVFPEGRGPQGDAIRIYNYVRCVRGDETTINNDQLSALKEQSYPFNTTITYFSPQNKETTLVNTPPQGAIEACVELKPNSDCSFSSQDSKIIVGTCKSLENQLTCVP